MVLAFWRRPENEYPLSGVVVDMSIKADLLTDLTLRL